MSLIYSALQKGWGAFPFQDGVYCLVPGAPPPPLWLQNLENN